MSIIRNGLGLPEIKSEGSEITYDNRTYKKPKEKLNTVLIDKFMSVLLKSDKLKIFLYNQLRKNETGW
ncbi:hypothetical protein [Pseudoalteromonas sp.]|uniref:hypothetical protein n=1 Tax=Pseudoalteromonas sp. TaxID=53249 RepID=UPI00262409F0|nr:hypothetical protein [Pseudoalteromonas sp.]MCP4585339.1 hypothetical protein [Pseudoalteromonas sp.]